MYNILYNTLTDVKGDEACVCLCVCGTLCARKSALGVFCEKFLSRTEMSGALTSVSASMSTSIRVGYAAGLATLAFALIRFVQKRASATKVPSSVLRKSAVVIRPVPSREQRSFTKDELSRFDGVQDPNIFISVKHVVFQVGHQLYGDGAPYHVYAGKEISRALAKSSLDAADCNKDFVSGAAASETATLELWFAKFEMKYAKVGWYVPDDAYYQV